MLVKQKVVFFEAVQWTDPLDRSLGVIVTRQVWATPRDTNFVVTESSKRQGKRGEVIKGAVLDPVTGKTHNIALNDWVIRDMDTKTVYRIVSHDEFTEQFTEAAPSQALAAFDDKLNELVIAATMRALPAQGEIVSVDALKAQTVEMMQDVMNFRS